MLTELADAACLAVSLVTGPMIKETVQIAKAAKAMYPDKPVILGGWHPSLLPDQTLACEYVDIVVKGQGEDALLEIMQAIEMGDDYRGIAGVGYKENGQVRFNTPRALKPLADMPPKAYHLADFDAYERVCGRRWAMYTSSLACPYNCGYCTNDAVYGRKWNALPAEQVAEETCDLVTALRPGTVVDRRRQLSGGPRACGRNRGGHCSPRACNSTGACRLPPIWSAA